MRIRRAANQAPQVSGLTLWKTFRTDYSLDVLLVQELLTSTDLINRAHSNGDGLNLTNIWDGLNSANDQAFWYTAEWRLQNANGPWGEYVYAYDDCHWALNTPRLWASKIP